MNSILVSLIVFAIVFAAAIIGMVVRLPEEHMGADAKEVVRLAIALVSTMAALVLGMLVSSAKASYDGTKNQVAEISSDIVAIDNLLQRYGPETGEIRTEFRQLIEFSLKRIWPSETKGEADLRPRDTGNVLIDQLEALTPKNDRQAAAKAQALSMISSSRRAQWLLFLKTEQKPIPFPLLLVLVAWLAAIFLSFGLFAAPNSTTVATVALSALAVSAALFIILEMYTPFSGVLRISPAPILDALSVMGR